MDKKDKKKKKKKKKGLDEYWEIDEESEFPIHEKYVKREHVKKG